MRLACLVTCMLWHQFVNMITGAFKKVKSKMRTKKPNSQSIRKKKRIEFWFELVAWWWRNAKRVYSWWNTAIFRLKIIVNNVTVTFVYALWHITMCGGHDVSQLRHRSTQSDISNTFLSIGLTTGDWSGKMARNHQSHSSADSATWLEREAYKQFYLGTLLVLNKKNNNNM